LESALKVNRYAIIDIETTGGSAHHEKIIEIAMQVIEDGQTVNEFQSLINPERSIPPFITRLTGITNEMVQEAPKFYEVAREIIELTEDAVFVAHNVRFDFGFIQEEFKRLGFNYSRKQLCTVYLSKKAFPGLRSYSLGNLIRHFNIEVEARHRAMADVHATSIIFSMILQKQNGHENSKKLLQVAQKNVSLPPAISYEQLEDLPEKTGVYYMTDKDDEVVYVGKSVNIRKRIKQHFHNINPKSNKLYQRVNSIRFEITGSDLVAFLLENEEIKRLQPEINRSARHNSFPYFTYLTENSNGYLVFDIASNTIANRKNRRILSEHASYLAAKSQLSWLREEFRLCSKLMGLDKSEHACFEFRIGKCLGACQGIEAPESYNDRVMEASKNQDRISPANMVLIDEGRNSDEMAVVVVRNGNYFGYGFVGLDVGYLNAEELAENVRKSSFYPDHNSIVKRFLQNPGKIRVLPLAYGTE